MSKSKYTTPELRFPEFSGQWILFKGDALFNSVSNKKHNSDLPILAITQEYGAVPRELIDYKISVTEQSIDGYKVVDKGDFIISLRSFQGGIEYSEYNGICSPAYIILKPKSELVNGFFKVYFKTQKYITELNRKLEGIRDGKMISFKYFSEINIPYPSLPEQTKIASFLTAVDDKLQVIKKKKEALERYKKGMMQKLFAQEIRFKDDHGNEFSDWEKKKLGEIATKRIHKNKNLAISSVLTNSANYGIVNQRDFFDKDIANQNNLDGYYVVEINDFVYNPRISTSAPVGPISVNKIGVGVMSPLYSVFRFTKGELSFYEFYFNSNLWHKHMRNISNFGARSDRMSFQITDFYEMCIPFPSLPEQTKIATFLSALDDKINQVEKQVQSMEQWKKGLLQKMFV